MRTVTAEQMKQIEAASLKYDLTYARLMENAGSAAAAFIRRTFQQISGLNCMVFCGNGNNGGDGFVVARRLAQNGVNVVVVLTAGEPLSEQASIMFDMLPDLDIPVFDMQTDETRILGFIGQADLIVDAIYGTGFRGELENAAKTACEAINGAIAAVVALDIPSGVECDTGKASSFAIEADFTVVFDSLKPVHVIPGSKSCCGRLVIADIGIPDEAREGIVTHFGSLSTSDVFSFLPPRQPDSHKGDHGSVLLICGSGFYRGAAMLCAKAALRGGAGLCCLASTEPVIASAAGYIPESTFLPLPSTSNGCIDAGKSIPLLSAWLKKASCVVFGCGLGDAHEAARLLSFLIRDCTVPLLIDADGINALAGNIHVLSAAKCPVILTPHPGEMARMLGLDIGVIESDRYAAAMRFASDTGVTLVLKGHETLTAPSDGRLFINNTGNSGLAKGGSGDVLSGIAGAFLAQGLEPAVACACAVHLHGLAGDRAAARLSQYSMLPGEILDDLAAIFLEYGR